MDIELIKIVIYNTDLTPGLYCAIRSISWDARNIIDYLYPRCRAVTKFTTIRTVVKDNNTTIMQILPNGYRNGVCSEISRYDFGGNNDHTPIIIEKKSYYLSDVLITETVGNDLRVGGYYNASKSTIGTLEYGDDFDVEIETPTHSIMINTKDNKFELTFDRGGASLYESEIAGGYHLDISWFDFEAAYTYKTSQFYSLLGDPTLAGELDAVANLWTYNDQSSFESAAKKLGESRGWTYEISN